MTGEIAVDLFFYGTLRDPGVRRVVLGPVADRLPVEPALIRGYRCAPTASGHYPILVPAAASRAEGVLVAGVGIEAAARTSYFEDDGYAYGVGRVAVSTASRAARTAWAYLPLERLVPSLGRWSIEGWTRRHRAAFVTNARRAMARCGAVALERYREDWRLRAADGAGR